MKYTVASVAAFAGYAAAALQGYGPPPAAPTSTPSCPAPGTSGPDGRYSCSPAHSYPAGQVCQMADGCYYLRTETPGYSASSTSTAPASAATPSCPAAGTSGPDGRHSCNPAHSYPAGQVCQLSDGCYYLRTETPGYSASATSTAPASAATPSCPAAGTMGPDGRYSCNPAHPYPSGQVCSLVNGCYSLCIEGGNTPAPAPPAYSPPAAPPAPAPSANATCPAPGSTDAQGRYSCNPAHPYPAGQVCSMVDGCFYLRTETPGVSTSAPPAAPKATTPSSPVAPAPACPAPGSTDAQGRYSCSPAHAYPAGQVCSMVDGCFYLRTETPGFSTSVPAAAPTGGAVPPTYPPAGGNSTSPKITPYTGGAAKMVAAGAPLAAVAVGVLFL